MKILLGEKEPRKFLVEKNVSKYKEKVDNLKPRIQSKPAKKIAAKNPQNTINKYITRTPRSQPTQDPEKSRSEPSNLRKLEDAEAGTNKNAAAKNGKLSANQMTPFFEKQGGLDPVDEMSGESVQLSNL